MLHKEAWVVTLLGTHLSIQVHKKVKFSEKLSRSWLKGLRNTSKETMKFIACYTSKMKVSLMKMVSDVECKKIAIRSSSGQ